jgi:hypothetical protein
LIKKLTTKNGENMNIEKNIVNLNIQFTSEKSDNERILLASRSWTKEKVEENLEIYDVDCLEMIINYLHDDAAIQEGLNVEIWFS